MSTATVIGLIVLAVMLGVFLWGLVKACRRPGRHWWKAALAGFGILVLLAGLIAVNVLINRTWPGRSMLIRIGI